MGLITDKLHDASTAVAAYFFEREQRQWCRRTCEDHKAEWTPLTEAERRGLDKKELDSYTVFKNMFGPTEDLRYFVSDAMYKTKLLPILNAPNHSASGSGIDSIFTDKNYAELFMPDITFPAVVIRRVGGVLLDSGLRIISEAEALALLSAHEKLVFKQTVETGHGTGIEVIERPDYEARLTTFADDYVVQTLIRQHPVFSYFNESSVNVLRVTTLCHGGDMYVLGCILRVGPPGCFFDHGIFNGLHYLNIGVDADGSFMPRALDVDNCLVFADAFGKPITGRVPRYHEILELLKRGHARYPQYRVIGWDVTLDEDENIVCVEFNTKWPGILGSQCCLGPIFAQRSRAGKPLLDEILQGK